MEVSMDEKSLNIAWEEIQKSGYGEIPCNRSGHATIQYGRSMFLFGGYDKGEVLPDVFQFDLDTNFWRRLETSGEHPEPRTSHSAVVDETNGLAYVLCGSGNHFGHTNIADFYEFDLRFHTWRLLNFESEDENIHFDPRYGQSAVYHNRKIFVFGGTFGIQFSDELFCFNLDTLKFRLITSPNGPSERYKHSVGVIGNHMIVFGGADSNSYKLNDFFTLNLDTLEWKNIQYQGHIEGRFAHSMSVNGSKAYIYGGTDRDNLFNDLYEFDLETKTMALIPFSQEGCPRHRYFHTSAFDEKTGSLLVFAGKGSATDQVRYNDLFRIRLVPAQETCALTQDLAQLLNPAGNNHDVVINALDGVLTAHSILLFARCPTLRPFLGLADEKQAADEMSLDVEPEQVQAQVNLPYSRAVVESLLHYVYADSLRVAWDLSPPHYLDLMYLALDLQLERLKCMAQLRLQSSMSPALAALCSQDERKVRCPIFEKFVSDYITERARAQHYFEQTLAIVNNAQLTEEQAFEEYERLEMAEDRHAEEMLEQRKQYDIQVPASILHSDLLALRQNSPSMPQSDIEFRFLSANGDTTHQQFGHRLVLSARSAYFGSYSFQKGMAEATSNICEFPATQDQFSPDTFAFLLDYLYAGEAVVEVLAQRVLPPVHPVINPVPAQYQADLSPRVLERRQARRILEELVKIDACNYFGLSNQHLMTRVQQLRLNAPSSPTSLGMRRLLSSPLSPAALPSHVPAFLESDSSLSSMPALALSSSSSLMSVDQLPAGYLARFSDSALFEKPR